jgi:hypothetical protein
MLSFVFCEHVHMMENKGYQLAALTHRNIPHIAPTWLPMAFKAATLTYTADQTVNVLPGNTDICAL